MSAKEFVVRRAFASKFHVGCVVYPDGSRASLPEPVYELFDVGAGKKTDR